MSVSLDIQKSQNSLPTAQYDVVVLGAGPYGLSVSAHLRGKGLKVATFGKPNLLWREHMPKGMLLRSYWWATSLSDPDNKYSFEKYFQEKGIEPYDPLPAQIFIDYTLWFQKNAVPDLDETYISNIERQGQGFLITLEDGRVIQSKTVVMAPGLYYYAYIPPEYRHMPEELVSHSSQHHDLSVFAGKRLVLIGRGQGALESAALAHEAGADVLVISRNPLRWVPVSNSKVPAWIRAIRAPQAGMGNGWLNWLLEKYPYTLHRFGHKTIDNLVDTTHGPAGSHWLKPRVLDIVPVREQVKVEKIEAVDGVAKLTLSSGEVIEADHVILGTGFRPDVQRLPMLGQSLKDAIATYRGSPALTNHFETTVPGLYFIGISAARSFGPFYRFVIGADAATRRVSNAVARKVAQLR